MRWLPAFFLLALACPPAHAERLYLKYEAHAWGFIPLGNAALDVSVHPDTYRVGVTLASGGLLRLFDQTKLSASADGAVDNAGPEWARYDLDHNYAKKHRTTAMHIDGAGVIVSVDPVWRNLGAPPASDAQKRAARDPLSSIVAMGMTIARTHKCDGAFDTFDGRFLYELTFSGGKEAAYRTDGYDGQVIKCIVHYNPIAGYEPKNARDSRKKTPKAEMWFALTDNPDFAPPVRMILPLGLGNASIVLTSWRKAQVEIDDGEATPTALVEPPAP